MSEIKNGLPLLPARVRGATIDNAATEMFQSSRETITMEGDFSQMVIDGRPPLMDRVEVQERFGMDHGELMATVTLPERDPYYTDNPTPKGVKLLVFDARQNKNQPPFYKIVSAEDAHYLQGLPESMRNLVAGMRSLIKEVRPNQPLYVGEEQGRWMPKDLWKGGRQEADRAIISRKQTKFFIDQSYQLVIESEGKNPDMITVNITPDEKTKQSFLEGWTAREDERLKQEYVAARKRPRHAVWPGSTNRPERVGKHRKEYDGVHVRTQRHLGSATIPK